MAMPSLLFIPNTSSGFLQFVLLYARDGITDVPSFTPLFLSSLPNVETQRSQRLGIFTFAYMFQFSFLSFGFPMSTVLGFILRRGEELDFRTGGLSYLSM